MTCSVCHPQVHTSVLGRHDRRTLMNTKTLELLETQTILPPMARLEQEAMLRLGEDWVKTWQVGLPKFDETPGGVNSSHFGLRNLAIAYDMIEYAKCYNMLGSGGEWFQG